MTVKKKTINPAAQAAEQVEAAVAAGKETVEAAVKVGARNYEKAVAVTREQVEAAVSAGAEMFKGYEMFKGTEMFKGYEDVAGFGKENIDAVMAASAVLSKGMQDLNKTWFALAQEALEQNVAATKRILGSKSVVEVVEIQSDLAKAGYDKAMAESRRLSDMSIKLAEEASAPIAGRVNTAMEAFTKPFAA